MSEPVSNAEIEDVLSSIRRLVSENAGDGGARSATDDMAEKLVLTPAFRVLDGAGESAETEPAETGLPEAAAPPEPESSAPLSAASDLEQKIAALEAAIGDSYEEWEPDGSEEEEIGAEPTILARAAPAHHPAPAHHKEAPQREDEPRAQVQPDPEPDPEPGEAPDQEVERAERAERAEAAEPSAEPTESPEPHEPHEPDMRERPEQTGEENITDDGAYLDEDTLRELVTQLVREELQGRVGERITRNVRRLVRREIQRALAIRDLE